MELLFNSRWWDYSYDVINVNGREIPLHINGRVSLRNSSILASLGFVFVYFVYPFLKWLCAKVNVLMLRIFAAAVVAVMGTDFVMTLFFRL